MGIQCELLGERNEEGNNTKGSKKSLEKKGSKKDFTIEEGSLKKV